jgi:hypothetical protein
MSEPATEILELATILADAPKPIGADEFKRWPEATQDAVRRRLPEYLRAKRHRP